MPPMKSPANRALSWIVRQASGSFSFGSNSEGIDRVLLGGLAHPVDQLFPFRDVDTSREERLDILRDADVSIEVDPRRRVDLDHDVDVAAGCRFAPRYRAEERRPRHAPAAKRRFMGAQDSEDGVAA